MALSDSELQALRLRCQQAMAAGFGLGKGDAYLAELAAELGQKPAGKATPVTILALLDQVVASRLGKPLNTKAVIPPEPEPAEPEEDDEPEEEEEDEDEAPASAPKKPAPSKPKPAAKSKPKAAKPKPKKR